MNALMESCVDVFRHQPALDAYNADLASDAEADAALDAWNGAIGRIAALEASSEAELAMKAAVVEAWVLELGGNETADTLALSFARDVMAFFGARSAAA